MVNQATYNSLNGLYYEFSIPLGLSDILQTVIGATQGDPNVPQIPTQRAPREWYSQPRPGPDPTTEVIQVNFKLPLSVGQLSFQALRVPCHIEVWYRNRNNNWVPLTDTSSNPIQVNLAYSATTSWYTYQCEVYPVVAAAVQIRITRTNDPQMAGAPYVVGLKETLIRRNFYGIDDTRLAIESQQDILGNTITSYVKNWDADNAIDNNPATYWKSFPCPDPNGVVCLYLDTRDVAGNPQLVDTVYLDPVYAGNILNLYYSNDPTQGTLTISSVSLPPDVQVNADWTLGAGLSDTSPAGASNSQVMFPVSFGPMVQKPVWIGLEWTPDFSPTTPPPQNPILFQVVPAPNVVTLTPAGTPTGGTFTLSFQGDTTAAIPVGATNTAVQGALQALPSIGEGNVTVTGNPGGPWTVSFNGSTLQDIAAMSVNSAGLTGGTAPSIELEVATTRTPATDPDGTQWWPSIYYDVGAGYITLELSNGTATQLYEVTLSKPLVAGIPIQVVAGWTYSPDAVFVSVTTQNGVTLGTTTSTAASLPSLITLDGEVGYQNFRGQMSALVVKQEPWSNNYPAFVSAPEVYCNPNPVQADAAGNYPSTSLDNAILAVDWTSQQFPIGGTHESWFENKTWTPIFANYVTKKGNLFLPNKVSMSYLKLEFTNLTAEPYPVYDQGIKVTYDTFPVSALQAASGPPTLEGQIDGLLTLGADIITGTAGGLNWFNPHTIQSALNANWGQTQMPIQVTTGPGTLSTSLPNTAQANIANSYRSEKSNPVIYPRQLLSASSLAGQQVVQASSPSDQTLKPANPISSSTMSNSFTPVVTTNSSNVLPVMGQDWWLFPGANLKMPASVMNGLTSTQVNTSRAPGLGTRIRFTTASVHRYNTKTVTLDASVAYFAGVNEVQPYVRNIVTGNDPASFDLTRYDPSTCVFTDIYQQTSGPVTTQGSPYVLQNPNFLSPAELTPWTATGNWQWDGQHGPGSQNGLGDVSCAAFTANGTSGTLVSEPIAIAPNAEVTVSALVAYYGANCTDGGELSISAVTYDAGKQVGTTPLAMPATAATYTVADLDSMLDLGAQQTITVTGAPTGGGIAVSYEGQTSASIAPTDTASQVQSVLAAVPTIGSGSPGNNEVQTITVANAASGDYLLSFNGQTTTTAITPAATASDIQTYLQALSTIGAGNVTVTGTNPYTVTFQGALADAPQNALQAQSSLVPPAPAVTVTVTTPGAKPVNDVQTLTVSGNPTGGTFTLGYAGYTTAPIPYNPTAAQIQLALVNLAVIGAGNVNVVAGSTSNTFTVTFQGTLAGSPQPVITGASSLTGGTSPSVAVAHTTVGSSAVSQVTQVGIDNAVGGTFTLTYDSQTSTPIAWDAEPLAVQSALTAMSNIGAGNIAVTGTPGSDYTLTWQGALAGEPLTAMTSTATGLTAATAAVAIVRTTPGQTPEPAVTVTGPAGGPWVVSFGGPLGGQPITTMTVATNSLTGGTAPNATIATTTPGPVSGDSCTIETGPNQGTYTLVNYPGSALTNWTQTGYGTLVYEPAGNINGRQFIRLTGTYTAPATGVDHIAVSLNVNDEVLTGNIYWAGVAIEPISGSEGTVYFTATTTSTFSDVAVKVSDSGVVRSDSMWARLDPLDTNIANLQLAPYVNTIPSFIPSGMWGDTIATWDSSSIDWGEPQGVVAINLDPNMIYQGNRAMHFTRAAGAGEAGITVTQQTNLVGQALARLCCVFYKTSPNTNQIIVRLRRVSDGVYIHEETFTPVVGFWYTYQGSFFELPDSTDQTYTIEFVATGNAADEIYLSNLYTEIAGVRYFLQLGGAQAQQFDITPLAYGNNCNVSTTVPVNQMSLTVGIFSPSFWAYGISLTPKYLK